MRYHVIIAAAALIPAAAAAQSEADRGQPDHSFTGPRVEAIIGWDRTPSTRSLTGDGLLYGGAVGYDLGIGELRVGADAEATDSTSGGCFRSSGPARPTCIRSGRDLYVGGRIGARMTSNILIYGKGGYTNFRQSQQFETPVGEVVDNKINSDGFRVGGGVELAITRSAFVKAEYRYSHYDWIVRPDRHQVVTAVGLRF